MLPTSPIAADENANGVPSSNPGLRHSRYPGFHRSRRKQTLKGFCRIAPLLRFCRLHRRRVMYNFSMLTPPRQNWKMFAEMSRVSDATWLRSLSPDERYAIYRGLFNAVLTASHADGRARVEEWAWPNKLERLRKQRDAFLRLDRHRDRSPACHAG